ncbi:ARP5 protein, partial [Amia calva]|nr:ARP5 protein [Amia calva]
MLDYTFMHLGITSEGSVEHPVVLTEAPCNPLHCRQMMSELLFECYRVPRVAYGVDSLYSFYYNNTQRALQAPHTGIVISSGYHSSHILPVIEGRFDAQNCKRINVGGSHAASYLQRLLQLKYPGHLAAITLSRMEELLHEHSYTALHYQEDLEQWRCPEYYEREVHRLQLPFSPKLAGGSASAEERQERRPQQLRRLQELNARRREEKLQQDQERLDRLLAVQELLEDGLLDQFHKALVELNMDSAEELQSYISKLSVAVEQGRVRSLPTEGPDSKPETPELEPSMEEGEGVTELEAELTEEHSESDKTVNTVPPAFNLAEYHQLFVGTERLRVPEILFQPSLIGEEQMGLTEALQFILDRYSPEQQGALARNVFLTGGNMQYPRMRERMERELLGIRPFQSHFQVQTPAGGSPAEGWITRQDYEEKGGEYLSEHCASNPFISHRIAKPPRASEPPPAPTSSTSTLTTTAPAPAPASAPAPALAMDPTAAPVTVTAQVTATSPAQMSILA